MCGVFLNPVSQIHTKWPPSHAGQKSADQTWARKVSGVQGQVWHYHHVWRASVWPGPGVWVLFIGPFLDKGRTMLRHLQGHKSTFISPHICWIVNPRPMLHPLTWGPPLFRSGSEDPWGKHSCACHQYRHPGQPWGSHHWSLHDLWTGSSGESCFNSSFPYGFTNHHHCNAIFFLVISECHTRYSFFVYFYSLLLLAASLLVCISVVPLSFRIVLIFHLWILNGKKLL